ncbi:hypothetical protein DPM19_09770 [Actinomadura craniellae]|uniref:Multi-ubiquitin domain-containing protein n=1 Tax=Actinomadura craniellae TaxID=2231787 RepID=A0A365H7G9_9ACTN|nr:hypothetical protein [Actinomadura craniellae]RAY15027.1 hypothetical protein DPM19_09770 [Actinomadura craniellae]
MTEMVETAAAQRPNPVRITVNHQPVVLPDRATTGMGIKLEAIRQGVLIEPNFVLSVRQGNHFVPVGDDEAINVHRDEDFLAVAPDDNS